MINITFFLNKRPHHFLIFSLHVRVGLRLGMIGQLWWAVRGRRREQHLLQVEEQMRIVRRQERESLTRSSNSTSMAYSICVGFDGPGHVVVDDHRDVLDVDAMYSDFSGDEDVFVSGLES